MTPTEALEQFELLRLDEPTSALFLEGNARRVFKL